MSKPKYINKAKARNALEHENLKQEMEALGWQYIPMKKRVSRGWKNEPFICFHRQVENPKFFSQTHSEKIDHFSQNQQSIENTTVEASEEMGGEIPMGVATSEIAPKHDSNCSNPTVSFDSILSLTKMRSEEDSFVIGYDTEFFYIDNQRYILSYQFAFVHPRYPEYVEELIVFPTSDETLSLSLFLSFVVGVWRIDQYYGNCAGGIPFYKTRRWEVPVVNRNGDVVARKYEDFNDALENCVDPDYKEKLAELGPLKKCKFDYVDLGNGEIRRVPKNEVNGFGLGYINDYSSFNKDALPIAIVAHSGRADLSALDVDSKYEKDVMTLVAQVQGGLVTLKDYFINPPKLSEYWNMYPIKITVRDTMCFSPADKSSLKAIGDAVGVPKLGLLPPYTKDEMLEYMTDHLDMFCDYAVNDALITLIYSGELWGYNKVMPVTITSASTKVAVPVIKSVYGLAENDEAGFNKEFRGLKKVKKGLAMMFGDKPAYIENTALEPVSDDARILQEYARQGYKGGFNGCLKPGYYEHETYDYDLCNAYPTCMGIVPDIDWDNPISFEGKNQPLSKMMVRNPFDPVFAYVTFEFPKNVKVPCIPVTEEGSLIYPRTSGDLDGVYASAPELWLALELGAKVFVKRIYVGTIKTDENGDVVHSLFHVVKQMIADRTVAKTMFGKGSVLELLIKVATNGLYGKTAQDVIDKHTWSARTEVMENIGGSRITSPVHACLITAGVRAVLVATLNQIMDLGYNVYSVTTDGFISDVPEDVLNSLDLFGLSALFRSCRVALTDSDTMWEQKHYDPDLLNLTTRGNCSLNTGDESKGLLPGVMAHNSFVTGEVPDSYEDREKFMYLCMTREGKITTASISFEKFKNLAKRGGRTDFSTFDLTRDLSMDFDLKRKPLQETMVDHFKYFPSFDDVVLNDYGEVEDFITVGYDDVGWVASFDTVSYDTPEEFVYYKNIGRACGVLRTVEDWNLFFDKINAKKDGIRRNIKDLEWSKLVSCVMAYRLGIPLEEFDGPVSIPYLDNYDHSVVEKVEWINQFNNSKKKFTVNTWKDCRKQTRVSQVLTETLYIEKLKEMVYWNEAEIS